MATLANPIRFLSLVVVALGAGPSAGSAPFAADHPVSAAANDTVMTMLRDTARRGTLTGLRWPRFPHYRDELASLYSGSAWQPVWSKDGRPTGVARAAIDVLVGADERGLHPADYDVTLLRARFDSLSRAKAPSASAIGWFDLALSVGVLRHVSDVHIGRVNPKSLSVGINVEPKKLDLARVLRDAIDRERVAEMVRDAEPRFVQYRNLKAAYTRYRSLAADSALPTVPTGRAVRVGEHFDGMAALRRRLSALGDLTAPGAAPVAADADSYDATVGGAVARFQERHGLAADSVLGPATIAALNVSPARRARQLELALERIRWLPALDSGPFVVVNVPAFALYAFDTLGATGVPSLSMNVVVGRAEVGRETPLFERDMRYIIFRPYWVIPPGILRREILPSVRRDPGYLARHDMELYSGSGDTGPAVAATAANIARVSRGELGIRRRPGPRNDLGLAKFIFPNDHNVYMHGTPATALFSRARRDFSHGCIRLQDPPAFAVWTLRDPNAWSPEQVREAMNGTRSVRVDLPRPLPVLILYATAVVMPDSSVAFYDDVYKHDARLEQVLAKGYPFAP